MPLSIHLFIHFSLAVLSGYLAGKYFKNIKLGILTGIVGGFLIDMDHVLEYLLVFNFHFNILYFLEGRQFLTSDQLHLWFHAWEYVPVLTLIGLLFRKKKIIKIIFFTLAFSMAVHLATDMVINRCSFNFYTLTYRAQHNFSARELMSPESYQKNEDLKMKLGI